MKKILAIALIALLTMLLAWRVHGLTKRSRAASGGSATVEGVETIIGARVFGRVAEVVVREGDRVRRGQTVARIDCADNSAALALAQARLRSAETHVRVLEAQRRSATHSLSVARANAASVRAQTSVIAIEHETASRDQARAHQLAKDGAAPLIDLEKSELRVRGVEEQMKVAAAQEAAADLGSLASASNVRVMDANVGAARAEVEVAEADVERTKLTVNECTIVAPSDGVVTSRLVEPGEVVAVGSRVLVTIQVDPARVTFFLPNAELARAHIGAGATVRVDAYPGRTFHGVVRRVAQEAEFTPRNVQTREDRDRLVYAVEIEVTNADGSLRAGMPAEASLDGTER